MPATRQDLLRRLRELSIETKTFDHQPVFTVEESRAIHHLVPGAHSKNLFLKDAKDQLWLVVAPADLPINLKTLPAVIGSKRLSFGSAALLQEVLGVPAGSVTPFALINDRERRVAVVLHSGFMDEAILNFHPLDNAATTSVAPADLLKFIRACGHEPKIADVGAAG
jgi:Ala-tRNA(Pro) deacylase